MSTTYLIDNSALTDLLNDFETVGKVQLHLQKPNSRLLISFNAYLENVSGSSFEHVWKRIQHLTWLLSNSDIQNIAITKSAREWRQVEIEKSGKLKNIPHIHFGPRWDNLWQTLNNEFMFRKHFQDLAQNKVNFHESRRRLKDIDRDYRKESAEKHTREDIRFAIESIHVARPTNLELFSSLLDISKTKVRRILYAKSNDSYVFNRTYIILLHLRFLGNAYYNFKSDDELNFLRGQEVGNWYDLEIISQASPFDFLITNDKDQRAMCNFLHKKGLIKARGITLQDFMDMLERK